MKQFVIVVADNVHEIPVQLGLGSTQTIPVVIENLKSRTFIDATRNRMILRESSVDPEYGTAIHPDGSVLLLEESAITTNKVSYIKLENELKLTHGASIVGFIEVSSAEEISMKMSTSSSIAITRYRLMSEIDEFTIGEMDGLTLEDWDYITFG